MTFFFILMILFGSLKWEGIVSVSLPIGEDNSEINYTDISLPAEPLNPSEFKAAKYLVESERRRSDIYENEIMYSQGFRRQMQSDHSRNGLVDERKHWAKSGDLVLIPYIISSKFDRPQRVTIANAFDNFHQNTCIRFIPRGNEGDYINIIQGTGCDSEAGRIGGEQILSLGIGCDYTDTAIHELNHAVGFWHEQNRPDRDNYVTVYLNNVIKENRYNFDRMSPRQVNSYGVEYDTNSIMHYDKYAFSRDPKKLIVLEPKVPNEKMGFAKVLSKSDILRIRKMYHCGNKNGNKWKKTSQIQGYEIEDDEDNEIPTDFSRKDCGDFHQNCSLVTRVSRCEENAWLKVTCRESCKTCANPCQDMNSECQRWASNGACQIHYDYMRLYCSKSCQICSHEI